MKQHNRWMVLVTILTAGLLLAACGKTDLPHKVEPSHVEHIEGTDLNRVEITEKAAERIDLKTVPVREEKMMRKRKLGAKVVDTSGSALVRVPMNAGDQERIDGNEPVVIRAIEPADAPGWLGAVVTAPDASEATEALYCLIDTPRTGLKLDERVFVEVSIKGSGKPQKIVPYAAVLYDLHGDTWVFTQVEPLVYVRAPIVVDYIEGDIAVLTDGPPVGTEVVTDGSSEIYGAETGIGGGGH